MTIDKRWLHSDGYYSQKEMWKIREYYETNEIVKKDLSKLSWMIYKDIKRQNEAELKKTFNKKELVHLVSRIKEKDATAFNNLVSKWVINENWKLSRHWSGKKGLMVIQTALNIEWYTGKNWKKLTVDGRYGANTFWALINYQKKDTDYKSCWLSCNGHFSSTW